MRTKDAAPGVSWTPGGHYINHGNVAILPTQRYPRTQLHEFFFSMPAGWRHERRTLMLQTLPVALVDLLTSEAHDV